eukprot:scaffold2523_cov243-Chaetoceros_neogracile.AAC.1
MKAPRMARPMEVPMARPMINMTLGSSAHRPIEVPMAHSMGGGGPNRRQGEYKKRKKEMQKFNNITIVPSFGARVRYIHRTVGFLINVRIGHNVGSP